MRSSTVTVLLTAALLSASCGGLPTTVSREPAAARASLGELVRGGVLRVAFNTDPHGEPAYSESSALIRCDLSADPCAGIGPDLAGELARRMGVPVVEQFYGSAAQLFEGGRRGEWDIAIVVIDAAQLGVAFTPPVLAVEQTYAVPTDSPIRSIADVDRAGTRIAVFGDTTAERYLRSTLTEATLVRSGDPLQLVDLGRAEAAAGGRGALFEKLPRLPGGRVLAENFTADRWAVAVPVGRHDLLAYASAFVADMKSSGVVDRLVRKNGVTGVQIPP